MPTPQTERQDYLCIDFDAICRDHPGRGICLESLLERSVDCFHELHQSGFALVILSEQAYRPDRLRAIQRHLSFIGMPYDVIMPPGLLHQEGFRPLTD